MLHARTRIVTANSVVAIDTVCWRQCSLKMSASEEANIDQTSTKRTPKQKARRWSDDETDRLIDLLEENKCLWDVFCTEYHLKDKRERAYSSIEEELDISVSDIRNKIVGLRSQLARPLSCRLLIHSLVFPRLLALSSVSSSSSSTNNTDKQRLNFFFLSAMLQTFVNVQRGVCWEISLPTTLCVSCLIKHVG